jgi:ATP-binding protein involved in chromosome partitioning
LASVPFLGEIPIDPRVAECGDQGEPIVHKYPDSGVAKVYQSLARTVREQLQKTAQAAELPEVQL